MRRASGSLIEFAFESRLAPHVDGQQLARLVRRAWRNNLIAAHTGEMLIRRDRVHQIIEGEMSTILPLVSRILGDPRHHAIKLVSLRPVRCRRFDRWLVRGIDLAQPALTAAAAGGAVVRLCPRPVPERPRALPSRHGPEPAAAKALTIRPPAAPSR